MSNKTLFNIFLFTCCCLFFTTNSQSFNEAEAIDYAYASALTHCDPSLIDSWKCGVACLNLTGYQPFFSKKVVVTPLESFVFALLQNPLEKKIVTAYRGTVGNYELLLEALQRGAVPYNLTDIPGALVMDYFYNHYITYIRSIVMEQLQKAYQLYPDYEFVFTGHSLGAALATINAFDAISQGVIPREQSKLYNFGSPRVGNYILAQAIQNAIPEIYRVVHWRDLVPHVPLCTKDAAGLCVKNATSLDNGDDDLPKQWPAYHLEPEIFFNDQNTNYTHCNGGEDPSCSNQFDILKTSMKWHYVYLNITMECVKAKETKDAIMI